MNSKRTLLCAFLVILGIIAGFFIGYFYRNCRSPWVIREGVPVGVGGRGHAAVGHANGHNRRVDTSGWPCAPNTPCTLEMRLQGEAGGSPPRYDCSSEPACLDFTASDFPVTFSVGNTQKTVTLNLAGKIEFSP